MVLVSEILWETLDLGRVYADRPYVFDSLIYLVLFVGVARVTLGRRFSGRGGTAVVGAVGVMLAFAAAATARRTGFALASLAPLAWAVLLIVLGLLVYDLLRHARCPRLPSGAITLVLLAAAGSSIGRPFDDLLRSLGLLGGAGLLGAVGLLGLLAWGLLRTGGRVSQPVGAPVSGTEHAPDPMESSDGWSRTAIESEFALARLIRDLIDHLDRNGLDRQAQALFLLINRRRRSIDQLYEAALHALARSGWRADPSRRELAGEVEAVLQAARENSALFRDALRVAEAALRAGNQKLLRESVEIMLGREQEAIRLARLLAELIRKIGLVQEGVEAGV